MVVVAAPITTPPEHPKAIYEVALVLVVFPIVVWVTCKNESGEATGSLFRFLGLVSYTVYVLHASASVLFTTILIQGAHLNLMHPIVADSALIAFMALLLLGTWVIDRYYDAPIRKALGRRLELTRDGSLKQRGFSISSDEKSASRSVPS
jgi:peptidoglycan/LPS O-acetylase OafA/YrhL